MRVSAAFFCHGFDDVRYSNFSGVIYDRELQLPEDTEDYPLFVALLMELDPDECQEQLVLDFYFLDPELRDLGKAQMRPTMTPSEIDGRCYGVFRQPFSFSPHSSGTYVVRMEVAGRVLCETALRVHLLR